MPRAWQGRLRPPTGPNLLAAIASVALVAGLTLAVVAADLSLSADIPLWDAALVVSVLAVLGSVIRFPEWWSSAAGWGANRRVCNGARQRRASHPVDVRQARSPRARPRPDQSGGSSARHVTGPPIDGITHRSHAEWLLAARRRDGMPRLQRQPGHGRSRG
jgi:hypothetical protein